MGYKSK